MEVKQHLPGMFSWADLVTTDHEGSKSFYTELLGLDATDMPMGGEGVHTTLSKDGRKSCAIYEMPREMKPMTGGLAGWQSYFTVSSADETAERIRDLGGSLTIEPSDASTSGRMALAQDPDGAHFFIWEPRDHKGAEVFGEPGALAWNELYTHDTEAAARFYGGLFGWSANVGPSPDGGEYVEFRLGGQSAAGMMAIKEEWGEMPASWSIYFAVSDLEASLEKAKGLGAKQITPSMAVEGVGRFAFIRDPQGAYLSIMQMAQEA